MSTYPTCLPAACSACTIPGICWLNAPLLGSSTELVETIREATSTVASGASATTWSISDFSRADAVGTW